MSTKVAKAGAWLLTAVIVALSVVPPALRPVFGPHVLEHTAIFVPFGACIGLGYPARAGAIVGAVFCTAIEVVQLWVPGRHARIEDLIVDVAATLTGLAVANLVLRPGQNATPLPARRKADASRR